MTNEVRTIELDFSRCGSSEVLSARLFPEERAGLAVGETVLLSGDSVAAHRFTVVDISEDGRDFTFRRL